jgi:hypothetical protein
MGTVNSYPEELTPAASDVLLLESSAGTSTRKVRHDRLVGVVQINAQTGTAYTLTLTDIGKLVTLTNAAAITLTVPTNASAAFPVGTRINLAQLGAGVVTVTPAGGVTVNKHASETLSLDGAGSFATLVKTATDTWWLTGRLA